MRLYLDIDTGQVSYTLGGPVVSTFVIYLRDKLPLELVYVQAGAIVTDDIVDGGTNILQRIGLKSVPAGTLLAGTASYTVETAGTGPSAFSYARSLLSLNSTELINYFADNVSPGARDATMLLEVETSAIDFTSRVTRLQINVTVRRDVLQPTDEDPISANESAGRAETAAANAELAAVAAAADAVTVAADKATVAADRVQTGLDRVATGADAVATAADRVQTGLDRVATGADAVATAADRVQTGLDRVATGQDATATAADRVQTGLDRVATGADAVATAASAAAASASQLSADTARVDAQAAAATAVAIAAGNLVPLVAARAVAGYVQCDGATTNRAAGIYGPFDATTNRRGWIAGAAALTLLLDIDVPATNVAAPTRLYAVSGTSAPAGGAQLASLYLSLDTSGGLAFRQNASDEAANNRTFTYAGFRAAYSGQKVRMRVVLTRGTTNPVVEVNGVNISASFTAASSGTPPEWLATSLDATWHVVGYNWPSGIAPQVVPILGTLTDAEAETWRLTGRLPAWVARGGSAAIVYTSNFSAGTDSWVAGGGCTIAGNVDGIDGEDDWVSVQRTSATGQVVLAHPSANLSSLVVNDQWFQARFRVYNASATARRFSIGRAGFVAAGLQSVEIPAATKLDVLVTYKASASQAGIWPDFRIQSTTAAGANDTTIPVGDVFYFKNIQVSAPGGALTIPVVQPCLVVGDGTHIGDNQGRLLGCLPITDRQTWRIVARTHISAAQDVQLLGGPVLLEANRSRIDSVAAIQNSGGALNLAIGSASGGTDLVASTSVASGNAPTELPVTLRYCPTQNIWARRVAGSGTGPFTLTIEGHRVAGNP